MKIVKSSRGTVEQFKQAIDNKMKSLQSSTKVEAAKGTISQFKSELENQIAEIQHSDIDSSQVISSIEDKFSGPIDPVQQQYILNLFQDHNQVVTDSYEDGDKFVIVTKDGNAADTNALWDAIQELEYDNVGCEMDKGGSGFYDVKYTFYHYPDEEVEGCDEVIADTIPKDDPARVRYLHDLIGFVQNEMEREDLPVRQTIFDTTDDALIITMGGDNVVEYEVPFADLKFDFDRIYEDVDYIVNAMI